MWASVPVHYACDQVAVHSLAVLTSVAGPSGCYKQSRTLLCDTARKTCNLVVSAVCNGCTVAHLVLMRIRNKAPLFLADCSVRRANAVTKWQFPLHDLPRNFAPHDFECTDSAADVCCLHLSTCPHTQKQ